MILPPSARRNRAALRLALALLPLLVAFAGCARYNTYYNASRAYDRADQEREQRLKRGDDVQQPSANEKREYELAVQKCQRVLDEYPGHGLTDDALFLMAKCYHRLGSHRMSISKFDLLFANFPATGHMEEALHLQALNYMYIDDVGHSNELLENLTARYPKSRFRAEGLRVRGENSFRLEQWTEAREHLERFLADYADEPGADDAAQKLGQALWKLEEYEAAAACLQGLADRTESHEKAFRARLLLARCLVRLGRHQEAEALAARIRDQAETYEAEGDVVLVQAESQRSLDKDGEAAALLENLPAEWRGREVGPRASDMLALIYLERWELEEARKQLQEAVKGAKALDDLERTRSLLSVVQDYLAAEQAIKDAEGPRAAPYRLLQATNLLFGLDRPRLALDRYLEVAGGGTAGPEDVARALYGAAYVCRERLQLPDSAAVFEQKLLAEHPDSPQAYQVRTGGGGDLLAHLLEQRRLLEAAKRAAPPASPQPAGAAGGTAPGDTLGAAPADTTATPATADSLGTVPAAADSLGAPPPATPSPVAAPEDTLGVAPADTTATAPPPAPADTTATAVPDSTAAGKGDEQW